MPLTLVHAADCHLDAPSRSLEKEVRARVEESARSAFEGLVDLAVRRAADCLVIAGDLFDRDLLRIPTEVWLPEVLGRATAAGVTVIVVTGNHDPGVPGGPADRIGWPSTRFHLVRAGEPQRIDVHRRDGTLAGVVLAAGHATAREHENLAARFAQVAVEPGVPVVGLLHAQVQGAVGEHDRYAPCTTADLAAAPCGYWALGHVHLRQQVATEPVSWYPGCLQGRHFGESGAKGALVVEVDADGTQSVTFHALAPVRWEVVALDDLGDVRNATEIVEQVTARFADLEATPSTLPDQQWLLRVVVSGRTPYFAELRGAEAADDLAVMLRERLGVLAVDVRDQGVLPPIDVTEHVGAPHVLGTALAMIRRARSDDGALAELLPAQLAGAPADPVERAAYVRALLDGLELEVAAALLEERVE
jgi:DNA repair exonuclease SbcCD nuclease subunit